MYADWLDERGDSRGDYLRAEWDWAKARTGAAELRLREMAATLSPVWVARVSRPPVGVCVDHIRFRDWAHDRVRPRLMEANLDWIEKRFGITLPADYQGFLLNYNGGVPEPPHFRIPGRTYGQGCYDEVVFFNTVWAAKETEIDWDLDLVWNLQDLEEKRSDDYRPRDMSLRWRGAPHCNLMIIGDGPPSGELDFFCLGCRGPELGKVFYVAPYLSSPDEEDYCLLAPSFAAFLGMLTDYDPEHVQAIKAGNVIALRRWLDSGGSPDELYRGMSLLEYGICHRRPEAIRELLARRARITNRIFVNAKSWDSPAKVMDLLPDPTLKKMHMIIRWRAEGKTTDGELVHMLFEVLCDTATDMARVDLTEEVIEMIPQSAYGKLQELVETILRPESRYFPARIGYDPIEERRKANEERDIGMCKRFATRFQQSRGWSRVCEPPAGNP